MKYMNNLNCSFNEDVKNYDMFRPYYCKELFYDIFKYINVESNIKCLEIGIGTGQATQPFLDKGYDVTAVEPGNNLAEFTKWKYSKYKNINIVNCNFEDYISKKYSFDLIYSATAFHWIAENIGYPKVMDLLKDNGCIALFWNTPFVADKNNPLHMEIQSIYNKYGLSDSIPVRYEKEKYETRQKTIIKYGFRDLQFKIYEKQRIFNAENYISLLNTYSDHRTLEENIKYNFEYDIQNSIHRFGNSLIVYDIIDLYLAKK